MGSVVWLSGESAALPLLVIVPVIVWLGNRRDTRPWTILLRVGAACYAALVIALAFFPFPLPPYWPAVESLGDSRGWPFPWISPFPFETIRSSLGLGFEWPAARFLLGNLLAFAPLGVLAPLLRPSGDSWARVALVGLAASLAVELTQLGLSLLMGFPYRVADVDDVILNVLGALLGYSALRLGRIFLGRAWDRSRVSSA